jgi:flavin reductase (DIM6/NTAB) family NADH-FMN oxidoreductase RutF
MRRFAATVTIVSACHEGRRVGMTATAVSSVTSDPPAVLVCLNRAASLHANMRIGVPFCINILAAKHSSISAAFSGQLKGDARFDVGNWDSDSDLRPFLSDAQANLFCIVDAKMDYGTHTIFIGKVAEVRLHGDIGPLIYRDGKYVES